MSFEPIAVDPKTAARMLGVGIVTFYKLMANGQIVGRKSGRRTLVRVADIHAYVDSLPAAVITFGAHKHV